MNTVEIVLWSIFVAVSSLFLAVLLDGLRRIVRARIQRRIGPPLLQTLYDLMKLLRIPPVLPYRDKLLVALPYMALASALVLSAMLPVPYVMDLSGGFGVISLFYMVLLVTCLTVFAGLIVPNPYSNAGSSRELQLLAVFEAFTALTIVGLAVSIGWLKLYDLSMLYGRLEYYVRPSVILLSISLLVIAYIESGFTPFDIGEAETEVLGGPLLELGGRYYALYMMSGLLKRYVLVGLATSLVLVSPIMNIISTMISGPWLGIVSYLVFLGLQTITYTLYSAVEAMNPRYRLDILLKPLLTASLLPLLAVILGCMGW